MNEKWEVGQLVKLTPKTSSGNWQLTRKNVHGQELYYRWVWRVGAVFPSETVFLRQKDGSSKPTVGSSLMLCRDNVVKVVHEKSLDFEIKSFKPVMVPLRLN